MKIDKFYDNPVLNERRIKAYRDISKDYNVSESTVRDIFSLGIAFACANMKENDDQSFLDECAMRAMQGILASETEMRANGGCYGNATDSANILADECYSIAHAMLAKRKEIMK